MTTTAAATIGALFSELAVVDNLVDNEEACDLTTRRALACVNLLYGSKMTAFFMRPVLKLQVRDCTQGNANWVNKQLLKRHERVVFRPVLEKWLEEWKGPSADFGLASIHSRMRKERTGFRFTGNFTYDAPDDLDQITAFFVGRMLTVTAQFGRVCIRVRDINSPRFPKPGLANADRDHLWVNVQGCKDGKGWFVGNGQQLSLAHWTLVAGTFVEAAKRMMRKWSRGDGGVMKLQDTPVDIAGAHWLAGEIRRRDLVVQELHLEHTATPSSHGMFGAVCNGKVSTTWLKTLILADNEMLGAVGMKRLAEAAARGLFPALRDLDLSNTCLCDEGMSALAPQFASGRGLCRLTDLDLGHNEFRDAGLWDLVKHMGGMTGLRHLNLYNNQFVSKDTWTKFSNHLLRRCSVCPALVTVHIDATLIGKGRTIADALERRANPLKSWTKNG